MPGAIEAIRLVRFLLHREDWNIGVIRQPASDIALNGFKSQIHWFPAPPPGTMVADPGCFRAPDGRLTLFAEYLDHATNRGEIWSAEIQPGDDPTRAGLAPLIRMATHMSYPFPFQNADGAILLTAETWQAGEARLWRYQADRWVPAGLLFPGRQVVDPTLYRRQDGWWLFCTFEDDRPNEKLHIFHAANLGDPWTPHRGNPVRQDRRAARPAGPLFQAGDLLIRPAQDCGTTYGAAVSLQVIRHLSLERFEEEELRRLEPPTGPYPHGLHTFCPAGDVTFVDGKRLRLDPSGVQRRFRARFGGQPVHQGQTPTSVASRVPFPDNIASQQATSRAWRPFPHEAVVTTALQR